MSALSSFWLATLLFARGASDGVQESVALAERVDQTLESALAEQGLPLAASAQDALWLRRLSLDLRGVVATADEVRAFLASDAASRRNAKVAEYLADPRFSDEQARRWSRLLLTDGGKWAERMDRWLQPWIASELEKGTTFGEITRAILSAEGDAPLLRASASSNSRDEFGSPIGFLLTYHDSIESAAGVTARVFLGLQIQCAQCHDHPFDKWTQEEFNHFTGFFANFHGVAGQKLDPSGEKMRAGRERNQASNRTEVGQALFGAAEMDLETFLRNAVRSMPTDREPIRMTAMRDGTPDEMAEMKPRTQRSPAELAAMKELSAAVERAPLGTDPLAELEADPAAFETLVTRLPAAVAEDLETYRHRRDLFSELAFLDGTPCATPRDPHRRALLAEWVTSAENPWYAKAIVNRVWQQLFGSGLVDPVDDLSGSQDQIHPELLDLLAAEFLAHGTDLRFLFETLVQTRAYGRSTSDSSDPNVRAKEERWVAAHPARPMTASQFVESVLRVAEQATADGEGAGRPARAGRAGRAGRNGGGAGRDMVKLRMIKDLKSAFENDASGLGGEARPSITQALYLMNGSYLAQLASLRASPMAKTFLDTTRSAEERLEPAYLSILGRPPAPQEARAILASLEAHGRSGPQAFDDVVWGLFNSSEFHTVH